MSRYDAGDVYCYPDSSVLRNKANLTDQAALDAFEADISAVRMLELGENPVQGQFNLAHLQAIHHAIFQDVYDWAGQLRTVDISRGSSRFANVMQIEPYAQVVFSALAKENWLKGCAPEHMAGRLAHYLSEINALHPFREGNGRAQRVFAAQLAARSGYMLDYSDLTQEQVYAAMASAFHGNEQPLAALLEQRLSPM